MSDIVDRLHTDVAADCEEAAAELEALRKDAARYRWLRSRFDSCAAFCEFAEDDGGKTWRQVEQNTGAGLILDAQIDAAMSTGATHE